MYFLEVTIASVRENYPKQSADTGVKNRLDYSNRNFTANICLFIVNNRYARIGVKYVKT